MKRVKLKNHAEVTVKPWDGRKKSKVITHSFKTPKEDRTEELFYLEGGYSRSRVKKEKTKSFNGSTFIKIDESGAYHFNSKSEKATLIVPGKWVTCYSKPKYKQKQKEIKTKQLKQVESHEDVLKNIQGCSLNYALEEYNKTHNRSFEDKAKEMWEAEDPRDIAESFAGFPHPGMKFGIDFEDYKDMLLKEIETNSEVLDGMETYLNHYGPVNNQNFRDKYNIPREDK